MEEEFEIELDELSDNQMLDIEYEIMDRLKGREIKTWYDTATVKIKVE